MDQLCIYTFLPHSSEHIIQRIQLYENGILNLKHFLIAWLIGPAQAVHLLLDINVSLTLTFDSKKRGTECDQKYIFTCVVFYCGDDVTPCVSGNARTLFICNHSSPEDIFLKFDFIVNVPNMAENVMWASFEPFRYSTVGQALWMRGDFFLKQVSF